MKKIILLIVISLLTLSFNTVYALSDDDYSEWSTIKTGYPGEEEAIQYGVIKPKTWSEWNINPAVDEPDNFFQQVHDFGTNYSPNEFKSWEEVDGKELYYWDLGEEKHIIFFQADVDCFYWTGVQSVDYYQPALQLIVDTHQVASIGGTSNVLSNWEVNLDLKGRYVQLMMSECNDGRRNATFLYNNSTILTTSLIKYSHVIEWEEPTDWRFDTPYELKGGAESQKPAERVVYRHPLNPIINAEKGYIYEDNDIEDILELASAIDYDGKDISEKIEITKFVYVDEDNNEKTVYNPTEFEPGNYEYVLVTYYVINDDGRSDTKEVKLYIIRDGEEINLNIYDRYISGEYINTLAENSIWKNTEYKNVLTYAIEWLERKKK